MALHGLHAAIGLPSFNDLPPHYDDINHDAPALDATAQPPAYPAGSNMEMSATGGQHADAEGVHGSDIEQQSRPRISPLVTLGRAPFKMAANLMGAVYGGIEPVALNAAGHALGAAILQHNHGGYEVATQAAIGAIGTTPVVGAAALRGVQKELSAYAHGRNSQPGFFADLSLSFARGHSMWQQNKDATLDNGIKKAGNLYSITIPAVGDAMLHRGTVTTPGQDYAAAFVGSAVILGAELVVAGTALAAGAIRS